MSAIENVETVSPSDGSETGVAPRSDPAHVSPIDDDCVWVSLHRSGWQEGESGVIGAVVEHLEPSIPQPQRWCVEFGAGEPSQVTCAAVLLRPTWSGLLVEPKRPLAKCLREAFKALPDVKIEQASVLLTEGATIDDVMGRVSCPPDPAVMVVDVDSIDYHIVESMRSRPMVLCVETLDRNSPIERQEPYIPAASEAGNILDDDFGTQLQANGAAMDALMTGRDYRLVFRSRFNSIYVRGDMVPKLRKKKLNLGAGATVFPGYINLDIKTGHDIRRLDYADGSMDEVYCSHVLEHFSHKDRGAILSEWSRVLVPGGTLRVCVPDMRKLAEQLVREEPEHPLEYLEKVVYGGHSDEHDHHAAMFIQRTLRKAMYDAGIGGVREFNPFMQDCSQNPYSLNLEGKKRWWPKHERPRVVLVLSQPRFTFSGHEKAMLEMAKKIASKGVELFVQPAIGAFWDRDMTIGTGVAIDTYDPDFLLYSDYDSVFEVDDVLALLDAINGDPTMAAVGAVQMSRHHDGPLVLDPALDFSGPLTRVKFQHFGLTLVRREVFDELPQPWFWSVPGRTADGGWDWQSWGRTDADITFWRNLDLLGFHVYQHNGVCIGHIVQCVKYPRKTGRGVMLVPIENYWNRGKPAEVGFVADLYRTKSEKNGSQS